MFIELTSKNGNKFLLNLNVVASVNTCEGKTNVWEKNGDKWAVQEPYEEVKRLIKQVVNEKI